MLKIDMLMCHTVNLPEPQQINVYKLEETFVKKLKQLKAISACFHQCNFILIYVFIII
jgi:hypothetical protein